MIKKMAKKAPKPKKKSNFLGFRLSEKTFNNLELLAKQEGKSRGIVAKDAIKQWLNISQLVQANDIIVITKSLLIQLFQDVLQQTLENSAEKAADLISGLMSFHITFPIDNKSLKELTKYCIILFGKSGLKWFNTIDLQVDNSHLIMKGLHELDEKFSIFFSIFFKKLLSKYFEYEYIQETEQITNNLIQMEFKMKSGN